MSAACISAGLFGSHSLPPRLSRSRPARREMENGSRLLAFWLELSFQFLEFLLERPIGLLQLLELLFPFRYLTLQLFLCQL
jgi:hypothetical protein